MTSERGRLKLVAPPAAGVVSLEEAKAHLAVEHTEHDTIIDLYIQAAESVTDGPSGFLGRALVEQTWDLYLDAFPCERGGEIRLPLPPAISVDGVFYLDGAGAEQPLDPAAYQVDLVGEPARILPASSGSWPTAKTAANAVRVRFTAGYLDTSVSYAEVAVPGAIRAAILIHVADLYRNRGSVTPGLPTAVLPWSAVQLLRPYRFHLGLG